MKKKILSLLTALVLLSLLFVACNAKNSSSNTAAPAAAVQAEEAPVQTENYDGKLVFDHSMNLKYARFFSVDYYKGGYKIAKVINTPDDISQMLIVPQGMSVPADAPKAAMMYQQPLYIK